MYRYIALLNFTDKARQSIKDTAKRGAAAKEAAQKFGVNMTALYWTLGEYDLVALVEAEDESAILAFNMATAAQGFLVGKSLRAFTADEMSHALAKLP